RLFRHRPQRDQPDAGARTDAPGCSATRCARPLARAGREPAIHSTVTDPIFDLSALFAPPGGDARWMVVRGAEVAIRIDAEPGRHFPTTDELAWIEGVERGHHIGRHFDGHFYAIDADDGVDLPDGFEFVALRALYPPLGDSL